MKLTTMVMIASVLQRISSRGIVALVLIILMGGQGCAEDSREYRESRGQVSKISVTQSEIYLRIAPVLRLRDGRLQIPKLHYYQVEQVFTGWRKIEFPGRLSSPINKNRPLLYVPISKNIQDYLFLIRKPIPKKVDVDGNTKTEYDWTDWHLLQVSAKDIAVDKSLVIPPFDEIVEESSKQKELLEEVRTMYEMARAEAEKKMNTPGAPIIIPRIAK
jgi:hypothetical protein